MQVLTVNAGSTSVKVRMIDEGDRVVASHDLGAPDDHLAEHLDEALTGIGTVGAITHRVVHGGSRYHGAVRVDDGVRRDLEQLRALAPLHNPPALAGIDALHQVWPGVPTVACFDTAFHATLPVAAHTYALPADWAARWELRRYGFHGLSCAWSTRRVAALLGRRPARLVICHLGGGASVTAVAEGASVDTTMGFTPLEGLVMATRSGSVDPGLLVWLLRRGIEAEDLDDGLEHRSGLVGLAGTGDMRALLRARDGGDRRAEVALAVYLHRLRAAIAAMAAATEGMDALVFTGGVGEHAAAVRAEATAGLAWLGVEVDQPTSAAVGDDDAVVSPPGAGVTVAVVHAREDLQMAHETRLLLGG